MRIGILSLANPKFAEEEALYKMALFLQGEKVVSVGVNDKLILDALILPDTGGINCVSVPFYRGDSFPILPYIPGQDQWMEHFILHVLPWYIRKRVPIIGIGTSGLVAWGHVLGQKIDYNFDDGQLEPLRSDAAMFKYKDADWTFEAGIYYGTPARPSDEDLWVLCNRLSRVRAEEDLESMASVLVPAPAPPAPVLQNQEVELPPPIVS